MYIHESEAHKYIAPRRVQKGVLLFDLKVTLIDTEPEVWRTVSVPSNFTLEQLGRVAARAIGWIPRYFHFFDNDGKFIEGYDPYNFMEDDEQKEPEEKKAKKDIARNIIISSIFCNTDPAKRTITMDYGSDGWLHEITFVDMKQPDKKFYPKCIDGKNACPPEDCSGGPDAYRDILAALSDRKHAEHKETKEWMENSGYKRFNPKKFSVASVSF
ncbi:hypothetical protein HA402_001694 [Bradysia odoriphaga]|nr:hypothetical protein HA402_001694 [Bradysia odoriphaga]